MSGYMRSNEAKVKLKVIRNEMATKLRSTVLAVLFV